MTLSQEEANYIVEQNLSGFRKEIEVSPIKSANVLMSDLEKIEDDKPDTYCKIAEAAFSYELAADLRMDKKKNVVISFRNADFENEFVPDKKLSLENCKARWTMLMSGLYEEWEINILTEEGAKEILEKGFKIYKFPSPEELIEKGIMPMFGEEIVYAISTDSKYIEDLEKMLYQNRPNIPFGFAYTIYHPNPYPGRRGTYELLVSNPSPELIQSIVPSTRGENRYPQLKEFKIEELTNRIRDMFYNQKKTTSEIAKELGVEEYDIRMWLFYIHQL